MSVRVVSALFNEGVPAAMKQLEVERFQEATMTDEEKKLLGVAGTVLAVMLVVAILYFVFVFWVTKKAVEGLPHTWIHYIIVICIGAFLGAKYMLAWPILVFLGRQAMALKSKSK